MFSMKRTGVQVYMAYIIAGGFMTELRQLFTKIIASYPDCPKNVVIGSLHWKRLASMTNIGKEAAIAQTFEDRDARDAQRATQNFGEGNSKRAFTLQAVEHGMELVELVTPVHKASKFMPDAIAKVSEPVPDATTKVSEFVPDATTKVSETTDGLQYSASQILQFVRSVNDENPIHRTNHPIVPGCLLLEGLLEWLHSRHQNPTDIYMRFKLPVYADEVVELVEQPTGRYNLHGLVQGCTVFMVKWM